MVLSEFRKQQLQELQEKLGYRFRNIFLLHEATCHNSWLFDGPDRDGASYERLEFLGDIILAFVLGEFLFHNFPDYSEADYSRIRSRIASSDHLYLVGKSLCLGNYTLMSRGEEQTGGRRKKSIIANVVEAVIAAIYLDSSLDDVKNFLLPLLKNDILTVADNPLDQDFKSLLQEYSLKKTNELPVYTIIEEEGPAHKKHYSVNVTIDKETYFEGSGSSKKEAQKEAARQALKSLLDLEEILSLNSDVGIGIAALRTKCEPINGNSIDQ